MCTPEKEEDCGDAEDKTETEVVEGNGPVDGVSEEGWGKREKE